MRKLSVLLVVFLLRCGAFGQQANRTQVTATKPNTPNGKESKSHIYMADTSEQALVQSFRNKMDNSETVMDAQIVSMKSEWHDFKDHPYFQNRRAINTAVTFKVYHWIKGSMGGDEVTFYVPGGKIGDTVVIVSTAPIYWLNERGIFFFKNKEPNTYVVPEGMIEIFGSRNGKDGGVIVGTEKISTDTYLKIVKQSITDTTAYQKYIHRMKTQEEEGRIRRLKYKNGLMPADSVHRAVLEQMKRAHSDTTKGGGK